MVMQGKRAFVATPEEGKAFNVLGHSIMAKVYGPDTNGDYYAFEVVTPAGLGIPPHVHQHEDEVIWRIDYVQQEHRNASQSPSSL
jgi:uncharacterized cupin superfamily protein